MTTGPSPTQHSVLLTSLCACVCCSCKQQQDLLSFLAVVLGLDNPAVNRLRLTWEVALATISHAHTLQHSTRQSIC